MPQLGLGSSLTRGGVLSAGYVNTYSLDFDGTNDYVDCGGDIDITGAFTISAWINTDTIGTALRCIACQGTSYFGLDDGANGILLYQGQGSSGNNLKAQTALEVDTWYHIVLTVAGTDAGDGKIYIDGVSDGDDGATVFMAAGDFQIGKMPNANSRYWNGNTDEVAIFDAVVAPADLRVGSNGQGNSIPADLTGMSNLQGWWRFEEGSGTSATDSSTNSNAGTITNGVAYSTDIPS